MTSSQNFELLKCSQPSRERPATKPYLPWCKQVLYGNVASLSTTSGGGAHGRIGIIMTIPALNATLTATLTTYLVPIDPEILSQIPQGSTTTIHTQLIRQHKEERRIYDKNTNMDDALNRDK